MTELPIDAQIAKYRKQREPVIVIGSAEGKGLSAEIRQQLDEILPKYEQGDKQ